jgi:hypothetical protein
LRNLLLHLKGCLVFILVLNHLSGLNLGVDIIFRLRLGGNLFFLIYHFMRVILLFILSAILFMIVLMLLISIIFIFILRIVFSFHVACIIILLLPRPSSNQLLFRNFIHLLEFLLIDLLLLFV